jgi:hypothetical protein
VPCGAQDPDAPAAVPGHRKDVHLRAIEQVSGAALNGGPASVPLDLLGRSA